MKTAIRATAAVAFLVLAAAGHAQEKTQKPPLHGSHWMAITGKPLAATAGARMFERGGNAVDAACAMLAATPTMWDVLSLGRETQALIYNPKAGQTVAFLEVMKTFHRVTYGGAGLPEAARVTAIAVADDADVGPGDVLLRLEAVS
jgi:hypothetical protein